MMAGDLHKPLIELLEDERKNGYEVGRKAGIREVVELVNSCKMLTDVCQEDGSLFVKAGDITILKEYWQAKLNEWEVELSKSKIL